MRTNIKQEASLTIEGSTIEDVDEFVYLGSKISQTGGTDEDIKARIKKACPVFAILRPVWRSTTISTNTKLRIFNSNVKSVLLYGSETWRVITSIFSKIQTFINRCLRQILKLRWFDRVTNTDLWERAKQKPMDAQIRGRKWRWLGHTLRKDPGNYHTSGFGLEPTGEKKKRSTKTDLEKELT